MNNENMNFSSDVEKIETPIIESETDIINSPVNEGMEMPKLAKNNSNIIILAIVALILLVGIGIGIFMIYKPINKPKSNNDSKTEFLNLAKKYVEEVNKLWNSDEIVCQNASNPSEFVKPSQLSNIDAYGGNAFYYVFINNKDASEMKLNVNSQKAVAGWVRIGKSDNSYYIALSDGKTYIVDKGYEYGKVYSALSSKDVMTNGNGFNYQYMNGEIFGSNTEGNGWGIGDYKLLTDGDDTNDGIYMSNGKKTAGYTPYCTNITE